MASGQNDFLDFLRIFTQPQIGVPAPASGDEGGLVIIQDEQLVLH